MNRLTFRTDNGRAMICGDGTPMGNAMMLPEILDRLAAYEDTGLEPQGIKELLHDSTGPLHKKLGKWIKAESEGRLLILPCKIGDTVYRIQYVADSKSPSGYVVGVAPLKFSLIFIDEAGKYVFLTREEAEAALRKEANNG